MNWASLILAAAFGAPAVVMLLHRKAPRVVAILAALTALCVIAGVPSLLAGLGHPIGPGPILLGIIVCAFAAATFFYFDVIRGRHKDPLMGQKAIAAGPGGAGGSKRNHHVRPLVAAVALAVSGLMVAINFSAVTQGLGSGFSQTVHSITRQQS